LSDKPLSIEEMTRQNIIDCVIRIGVLEKAYVEEMRLNSSLAFTYINLKKEYDFNIPETIESLIDTIRINVELRKSLGFDD